MEAYKIILLRGLLAIPGAIFIWVYKRGKKPLKQILAGENRYRNAMVGLAVLLIALLLFKFIQFQFKK